MHAWLHGRIGISMKQKWVLYVNANTIMIEMFPEFSPFEE